MADSLVELRSAIDAFVAERDWAQFHAPKNLAMGVAIEAAEIMEHFFVRRLRQQVPLFQFGRAQGVRARRRFGRGL